MTCRLVVFASFVVVRTSSTGSYSNYGFDVSLCEPGHMCRQGQRMQCPVSVTCPDVGMTLPIRCDVGHLVVACDWVLVCGVAVARRWHPTECGHCDHMFVVLCSDPGQLDESRTTTCSTPGNSEPTVCPNGTVRSLACAWRSVGRDAMSWCDSIGAIGPFHCRCRSAAFPTCRPFPHHPAT